MELTIPGAVARAAREFGDAVALAQPLSGPLAQPRCPARWLSPFGPLASLARWLSPFPARWLGRCPARWPGRMAPGSATANWASG